MIIEISFKTHNKILKVLGFLRTALIRLTSPRCLVALICVIFPPWLPTCDIAGGSRCNQTENSGFFPYLHIRVTAPREQALLRTSDVLRLTTPSQSTEAAINRVFQLHGLK